MKILQINNYHYLRGGAERVYLDTSQVLENNGHHVMYFSARDPQTLPNGYSNYFVDPINYFNRRYINKILSVPRFTYSREARYKLESLICDEKPDIAHLHIFYGRLTSSILPVLKRHHIPVVMTVHEYKILCPVFLLLNGRNELCEKCASGNYLYCILEKCNRSNVFYSAVSAIECWVHDYLFPYEKYIDKFIMVSKFIRDKHLQYRPLLSNKSVQINNFIDLERFVPAYQPGKYYLYVGRLSKEKGIMTLLEAWKHFPQLRLKLAGAGPLLDTIRAFLKGNNLKTVEILGHVEGEELVKVYQSAKYVILPTESYETFGLSIAEGLACGKPALGANIGAIAESVLDGKTGFLFESNDVISLTKTIALAESINKNDYTLLSNNARQHAEVHFNKNTYYSKLLAVYRELIAALQLKSHAE